MVVVFLVELFPTSKILVLVFELTLAVLVLVLLLWLLEVSALVLPIGVMS